MADTSATGTPSAGTPPPSTQPPPAGPPPFAPRPRLTRSRSDRKIAGVCGGLGAYLGIDPVIIRILIVVLTIFGGSGLLLYAVGWLLIPDEDEEHSVVQGWFDRGSFGPALVGVAVAVGVLLVLVALVGLMTAGDHVWFGNGPDLWPLVVVAGVVGAVWYSRRRPVPPGGTPPGAAAGQGWPSTSAVPTAASTAVSTAASSPATTIAPPAQPPADPAWPTDPYGYQPPPPPGPPPAMYAPPPPAAPRRRRERSVLGPVTLSVLLIASGVMVLIDRTSRWDVHPVTFLAVLLGITGLGLVVGGWVGRSRGLIGMALLLTLLTAAASAAPSTGNHRTGDVHWVPTSAAALPADGYQWGAGDATLDLRGLTVVTATSVRADLGVGHLRVLMPADARVLVHAHVGLGSIQLPEGPQTNGVGQRVDTTLVPPTPTGATAPPLTLTLDLGIGELEVDRA